MPEPWAAQMDAGRLADVVRLAAELHRGQLRKGTSVPYMSHLLAVAALVAEDNGSEVEVMAALLHDAAEDQGGELVLTRVAELVGNDVAGVVRECSDAVPVLGDVKAPWRERKEEALRLLPERSASALKVIAADKLHNLRATRADLLLVGPMVWDRFKTGRDGFVWYHERMAAELLRLAPRSRSAQLLADEVRGLG